MKSAVSVFLPLNFSRLCRAGWDRGTVWKAGWCTLWPLALLTLVLNTTFAQDARPPKPLFSEDEILDITLSGAIRDLMQDRSDEMGDHSLTLSHKGPDGRVLSISLKARTRGHFRRTLGDCEYPPILLNFPRKKIPDHSVFTGQNKVKLVTPCQGDQYVLREYLVYRMYNIITPKSFLARLVRVVYDDTVKQKSTEPLFGILLEDEDDMAERNNRRIIKDQLIRPELTRTDDFLSMAVFEYLIGNTDWSVQYAQNIKILEKDTVTAPSPVPYDFDHSGIVRAPYAQPAPALQMSSVRQRRYRGYCMNSMDEFKEAFDRFNLKKNEIYSVYSGCEWLKDNYVKSTLKYLDEFYDIINNPEAAEKAFTYPCNEHGTGNVVIKGLK